MNDTSTIVVNVSSPSLDKVTHTLLTLDFVGLRDGGWTPYGTTGPKRVLGEGKRSISGGGRKVELSDKV